MMNRRQQFKQELMGLLDKYNAEMSIRDDDPYDIDSPQHIEVEMDSVWDNNKNLVHEFESFSIGTWCNKDCIGR